MNAKNTMRLLEKCAAVAAKHYPDDNRMRALLFVSFLASEFDQVGEPVGQRLTALIKGAPTAAPAI